MAGYIQGTAVQPPPSYEEAMRDPAPVPVHASPNVGVVSNTACSALPVEVSTSSCAPQWFVCFLWSLLSWAIIINWSSWALRNIPFGGALCVKRIQRSLIYKKKLKLSLYAVVLFFISLSVVVLVAVSRPTCMTLTPISHLRPTITYQSLETHHCHQMQI